MLGQLPTRLKIRDTYFDIRTDYRNVLRVFEAFADKDLTDNEKLLICLKRMYIEFQRINPNDYKEAYEKVCWFIGCGKPEEKQPPVRSFNWIKDEPLVFPAVNKVAGVEVRSVPYVHWWTFMGYYASVGESVLSTVVGIRDKIVSNKKLEKWEKRFRDENPQYFKWQMRSADQIADEEYVLSLWNSGK